MIWSNATQRPSGKDKKVTPMPPERGVPAGLNLPNLDEVRNRRREEPKAPPAIESTMRARQKPAAPPRDKKSHHRNVRAAVRSFSVYPGTAPQSGPPPFTDDPLKDPTNPDSFKIKAVHITELRTAINTVRNRHHLANYPWAKPTVSSGVINTSVLISWEAIDEMRTALNQAIGPPPNGYAANLGLGLPVLAVHIQELRERVKDILGSSSISDQLVPARIDLLNQSGNQIEARDCEWGVSLIGLTGRAGLDLGIGLTYSSMVWTQAGSYISFDDDRGDPSPGFKIGFPTIQGPYTDNLAGRSVYLLVTSAGRRVELRRTGTSNIYEAGDSSYLQLIDNGGSLLMRTTDGTQMGYGKFGSDWHCTGIEDRNGNVIFANYDSFGDITNVTDTLGRVFTFNYDGNVNLQSISQTWTVNGASQTHTWATFGWGTVTMAASFSNVTTVGIENQEVIPVLTQVGLPDGSHYNFEYTNRGQVNVIRHYAADGGPGTTDDFQLSYLAYNYETPAADCPRISAARVWASNWTGINGVPAEVVTGFADNHDGSHQMTAPDGTVYKEVYGGPADLPAWQHGLVTSSQVITGSTVQKTTTTSYDQDNTSVNYQTNPRVIATDISDGANHRRTTIDYGDASLGYVQWGLPYIVRQYGVVGTTATEIRRTQTDYNLNQPYLGQRIIGLVSTQQLYDSATNQLSAKTTYTYDSTAIDSQAFNAVNHDTTYDQNYNSSIHKRGNVTEVSRWDVPNTTSALTSSVTYNAAGSVLTTTDPAQHTTTVSYLDSFSNDGTTAYTPHDGVGNIITTFAYPTTATDADGFSSSVNYNYDFGVKTRAQGPPPLNQSQGIIQTFSYDEAMRSKQVTTTNTGAYVHYDYGPDYTSTFSSVNTVAPNYWQSDSYTNQFFDGLGRVFAVSSNHPGSTGGNKAQYTRYDQMGRPVQQTNPFEIDSGWNPTGDDQSGYQFNVASTFDWKGRPLRTYNMDGTYREASYAGCGCAGGEVVTLTDEVGRQPKIYADVLGRQTKTEILQTVNNVTSVYSTVVNTFNVRDQVTLVRQYAGTDQSSTFQDTTMDYDGYGRLWKKHVPEQRDQSDNPTYTIFSYWDDDTAHTMTDARGAVSTYLYNGRHQVTSATSALSGQPTISRGFEYDAAGNRKKMTDGLGEVDYVYDSLSRMTSETRTFNGVGAYQITYGYNVANQLTSVTDPFGQAVTYNHDASGRLNSIGATGYPDVTQFASSIQYRAWGSAKNIAFGNGKALTVGYNSRLEPTSYQIPSLLNKTYQYWDDGALKYAGDSIDGRYDRAMQYDQVGRLTAAQTGSEARGIATPDGPFNQTFQYDPFDHTTNRTSRQWNTPFSAQGTYTNNRHNGWSYNADGDVLNNGEMQFTYDAASEPAQTTNPITGSIDANGFDGDGNRIKSAFQPNSSSQPITKYYLRSTVLGGKVIADLLSSGQKMQGYVYGGDGLLAVQKFAIPEDVSAYVVWNHGEPSGSVRATNPVGNQDWTTEKNSAELDMTGADMKKEDPGDETLVQPDSNNPQFPATSNPARLNSGCTFNNMPIGDCGFLIGSSSFDRFNLVESASESSKPKLKSFSVAYYHGRLTRDFGLDAEKAWNEALEQGNVTVNWTYRDATWFSAASSRPQNPDSLWGQRRHPSSPGWRQKPVNWGSACGKFARSLANRLYNAVVRDRPYGDDMVGNLSAVGVPMRVQAVDDVDENGNPYAKGKYPIDGFKESLTAYGQDADVYHHILFVAGNILDHDGSTVGFLANQVFIGKDRRQAAAGRKESYAELADDYAGEKAGNAMLKTGRAGANGDYESLALTIARTLCK